MLRLLAQINCKLVGVPPGISATRKICYLHMAAGSVGGLVIAMMAVAANAFDVMFVVNYGISAGCTGVLLMTNLFVSVIRKVGLIYPASPEATLRLLLFAV